MYHREFRWEYLVSRDVDGGVENRVFNTCFEFSDASDHKYLKFHAPRGREDTRPREEKMRQ